MKKRKLNYRFHNPNTAEATAEILLKVLVEVNTKKVEKAVQEEVLTAKIDEGKKRHSA